MTNLERFINDKIKLYPGDTMDAVYEKINYKEERKQETYRQIRSYISLVDAQGKVPEIDLCTTKKGIIPRTKKGQFTSLDKAVEKLERQLFGP